jgi:hypothetical protein
MNCTEAKRHLDLFLDGELDVEQNLKVLEHLNLCACCSKAFDGERLLDAACAKSAEKCPDQVKRRCGMALDREGRGAWMAWAAAAALLLAGVAIGWMVRPQAPRPLVPPSVASPADLAANLVAFHNAKRAGTQEGGLTVEGTDGQGKLETFFKQKGVDACLHCLEKRGYSFKGGEVWVGGIRGRMICLTTQVAKDHPAVVTHTTVSAGDISLTDGMEATWDQHPVRVFQIGGRVVILEECGSHVCIFVTDSSIEAERLGIAMRP